MLKGKRYSRINTCRKRPKIKFRAGASVMTERFNEISVEKL